MKTLIVILINLFFITSVFAQNHAPVVSNLTAQQRVGTKYVDITYNVSETDGDTLTITIQASSDSGKTFTITPVTFITGSAVGSGIRPGNGKSIVRNAGVDYVNQYGTKYQVKVIANENKGGRQVINDGYGDYAYVAAGEFEMGDNFNEGRSDERPVHTVNLNAYYIGKYEVTNAEYKKFINDRGYTTQAYWTAGGFGQYGSQPYEWNTDKGANYNIHGGGLIGNENYPVVGVNWYEAMAYCKWLSAKTGKTYRLPTEAEWEKAARGDDANNSTLGHQRRYPWGDNIDGSYANFWDSGDYSDDGVTTVGFFNGSTQGSFVTHNNASPYGVYDMAGNVWEWCYDWYGSYSSSTVTNPVGPSSGSRRVMRGNSWLCGTNDLRSANRGRGDPVFRGINLGFRCLREP